jgi:hypothetical protein
LDLRQQDLDQRSLVLTQRPPFAPAIKAAGLRSPGYLDIFAHAGGYSATAAQKLGLAVNHKNNLAKVFSAHINFPIRSIFQESYYDDTK